MIITDQMRQRRLDDHVGRAMIIQNGQIQFKLREMADLIDKKERR